MGKKVRMAALVLMAIMVLGTAQIYGISEEEQTAAPALSLGLAIK